MMGDRMVILCMVMAFAAIVYSLFAMYRTFMQAYKRRSAMVIANAEYDSMCRRLKSVEDDVRANKGTHYEESVYLDRAEIMNKKTPIFRWINSQTEWYES